MEPTVVEQNSDVGNWYVYMIKCGNGTLYTGITTDVERRFSEHEKGGPRAARYLKGKGPLTLVFQCHAASRQEALKLEHTIKKLPRAKKILLVDNQGSGLNI